ncbi:unnamed protein product [Dibothriocephalus latus]|uniref:Uncharacterized protein n=1 Tax=Dibothriocephalus latus TaxID=60516 RepID=A0A3P7L5T7_DIBLA|nr:unnamed protein product [Dibothriocephalus latus]
MILYRQPRKVKSKFLPDVTSTRRKFKKSSFKSQVPGKVTENQIVARLVRREKTEELSSCANAGASREGTCTKGAQEPEFNLKLERTLDSEDMEAAATRLLSTRPADAYEKSVVERAFPTEKSLKVQNLELSVERDMTFSRGIAFCQYLIENSAELSRTWRKWQAQPGPKNQCHLFNENEFKNIKELDRYLSSIIQGQDEGFTPEDVEIMRAIHSGGYLLDLSGCILSSLPDKRLLLEALYELNLSNNNFKGNDLKYIPFGLLELLTEQVLQVNLDYNPMHCLLPMEELALLNSSKAFLKNADDRLTGQYSEQAMDNTLSSAACCSWCKLSYSAEFQRDFRYCPQLASHERIPVMAYCCSSPKCQKMLSEYTAKNP